MKELPIIELADPDGGLGCLHSGGGAHDAEKADEWKGFEAELAKNSLEKLPPSLRARVDWQAARQEPKRRAAHGGGPKSDQEDEPRWVVDLRDRPALRCAAHGGRRRHQPDRAVREAGQMMYVDPGTVERITLDLMTVVDERGQL
jgi:hypothetical protein